MNDSISISANNGSKKHDFERIIFKNDCDVDEIINRFFMKYGETINCELEDYDNIICDIKQVVQEDRISLSEMKCNDENCDHNHPVAKVRYIKHCVNPELNNGKLYYVYCIDTFV